MGIKDLFGKKKGFQCARDPNTGNMVCDVFEISNDGSKISTGTHINANIDDSCNIAMTDGTNTIVSGDEEEISKIKKSLESGCRKGIA
jgi:hypothetical protein